MVDRKEIEVYEMVPTKRTALEVPNSLGFYGNNLTRGEGRLEVNTVGRIDIFDETTEEVVGSNFVNIPNGFYKIDNIKDFMNLDFNDGHGGTIKGYTMLSGISDLCVRLMNGSLISEIDALKLETEPE